MACYIVFVLIVGYCPNLFRSMYDLIPNIGVDSLVLMSAGVNAPAEVVVSTTSVEASLEGTMVNILSKIGP